LLCYLLFVTPFFCYYHSLLIYSIGLGILFLRSSHGASSIYSSFGSEFFSFFCTITNRRYYFLPFNHCLFAERTMLTAKLLACPLPLPRTVIRSAVPLAQGPYLFVPIICWIIFASFFYQFLSSSYSMLSHSISLGIINRITSVLQLALILLYLIQ
jgi:hypothetical protein